MSLANLCLQAEKYDNVCEQPPPGTQPSDWPELVGPAFQRIQGLRMLGRSARLVLDAAFWGGLSACSQLTSLQLAGGTGWGQQWDLGPQLTASPQLLRVWLPHVAHLACPAVSPLLPLVAGLGASLQQLDLSSSSGHMDSSSRAQLAEGLVGCQQLQRVSLPHISQPVLDALVSLPCLGQVEAQGLENLEEPRQTSSSAWQELSLQGQQNTDVGGLGCMPLKTTQRLVLRGGLCTQAPPPGASFPQLVAALRQAVKAVARVPDLQWSGKLEVHVRGLGAELPPQPPAPPPAAAAPAAGVLVAGHNHHMPLALHFGFGAVGGNPGPPPALAPAAVAAALVVGAGRGRGRGTGGFVGGRGYLVRGQGGGGGGAAQPVFLRAGMGQGGGGVAQPAAGGGRGQLQPLAQPQPPGGGGVMGHAHAAERISSTIKTLAPLARRGWCGALVLSLSAARDRGQVWKGLGGDVVSALGVAFGAGLTRLDVKLCGCPVAIAPSFWPALQDLPSLSKVVVDGWCDRSDSESVTALVQFVNTYDGSALEITLGVEDEEAGKQLAGQLRDAHYEVRAPRARGSGKKVWPALVWVNGRRVVPF